MCWGRGIIDNLAVLKELLLSSATQKTFSVFSICVYYITQVCSVCFCCVETSAQQKPLHTCAVATFTLRTHIMQLQSVALAGFSDLAALCFSLLYSVGQQ